ncbi:MAG: cupin domain-containing protein [Ignavibacteriales bacterium]|nr:MAG: cupin domain-containing protein [Ignavibacteriales bacterium]
MSTKEDLTSKTINAAEFIQYSDGSIVSKQIIKKDAGTITLFAFDKGQSLSEHTAPFDAFVQIVDGKAECTIDGKPVIVSRDEFIILPANIPHAVNAVEKFKMLIVMIKNQKT